MPVSVNHFSVRPILTGSVLVLLTLLLWRYTIAVEEDHIRNDTSLLADAYAEKAEITFGYAEETLLRLVDRVKKTGDLDRDFIAFEAELYVKDIPALNSFGWTDEDFILNWITPARLQPDWIGRSVITAPERAEYFEGIKREGKPSNTGIFKSFAGPLVLGLHAPLTVNGSFDGLVGAQFHADTFFQEIHKGFSSIHIKIVSDVGDVFQSGAGDFSPANRFYTETQARIGNSRFSIAALPSPALLLKQDTHLPETVLVFGLMVSALVTWILHQYGVIQRSSETVRLQSMALNQTADAMFMHDKDYIITDVNEAALNMFGYSRDELIGMNVLSIADESVNFEDLLPVWHDEMGQGKTSSIILPCHKKDGTVILASINDAQIRTESGGIYGTVSMVRDVTKTMQREAELARSERRFRSLFEANVNGIIIRESVDGGANQIIEVNQAYLDMLGYTRAELKALPKEKLAATPEDRARVRRALRQVEERGYSDPIAYAYRRKDGSTVDASAIVWQVLDEQGNHFQTITVISDITEQLRTEQRLKEAQSTARIGSWDYEVRTKQLTWSDELFKIFERDPRHGPIRGAKGIAEVHHPEDRDRLFRSFTAFIESGEELDERGRLLTGSGGVKHLRYMSQTVYDNSGGPVRRMGTVQDITKEVLSKIELEFSSRRFRSLFEANQNGIVIGEYKDGPVPEIVEVNQAYQDLVGYSADEIRSLSAEDLFTDTSVVDRVRAQLAEHGAVDELDVTYRHKDGHEVFATLTVWRVYDEHGKPYQSISVVKDVSDRRRIELQLAEAQHVALMGSWERDEATGKITWSAEMYRLFEHDPSDGPMSSEEFVGCMHPEDRPAFLREHRLYKDNGENLAFTGRFVMKGGTIKYMRLISRTTWVNEEQPVRRTGTIQDVTAQVELEEKLRHTERLQSLGQLTGGIAHDYNNILGIVSSTAQLMEMDGPPDGETQKNIDRIKTAVKRGAALTDQLLSFSRKQSLAPHDLATLPFIKELGTVLQRTLGERIAVKIDAKPNVWGVHADENQLSNAILNLALNARDAMNGSGQLVIEVKNVSTWDTKEEPVEGIARGDFVKVSVADTGNGMDKQTLEKAFEPFFTTKEVGKGSGLGLSMVYGFAEQSGGGAVIESQPGVGTTVSLFLPAVKETIESTPLQSDTAMHADPQAVTILVVEDELELRDVTNELLKGAGYTTVLATNGQEAIRLAKATPRFDAALLDVVLPGGINGVELAAILRKTHPGMKIIFTTGYAAEDAFADIERIDYDGLFRKPVDVSALLETFSRLFEASSDQVPSMAKVVPFTRARVQDS